MEIENCHPLNRATHVVELVDVSGIAPVDPLESSASFEEYALCATNSVLPLGLSFS
ncbi:MAG: hypothetical protein ABIV13_01535 [Fimbriimonadales bacterium]